MARRHHPHIDTFPLLLHPVVHWTPLATAASTFYPGVEAPPTRRGARHRLPAVARGTVLLLLLRQLLLLNRRRPNHRVYFSHMIHTPKLNGGFRIDFKRRYVRLQNSGDIEPLVK